MNFNFGEVKAHTKKNVRVGGAKTGRKGQSYTGIKYKVGKTGVPMFTISNSLWDSLDMDNNGFVNFPISGGISLIAVVENSKALLWGSAKETNGVSGKKSKTIRAGILEDGLKEIGVLNEVNQEEIADRKPVMQYVELQKYEGDVPEAFTAQHGTELYIIVAGGGSTEEDDSSEEIEEEIADESPEVDAQEEAIADMGVSSDEARDDDEF